ncbi:uncharacterized protein LOC124431956 [Vespa crabro]|uniref:uncharacterized protein LOC124431956 n=1 Tax=Vespa crabro TaxID=7445 RepID=UPI001F012BBA|nr:uncharacterized protein LOC124431956 [Vespa crabro]
MKFTIALVAILATANAWTVPNLGKGELYKDLQEFVDLIPVDKVIELVKQYMAEDAEVKRGVAYTKTEEFKELVQEVEAIPEYIKLLNCIYEAGVDSYYLVNRLHKYLGLPELTPPKSFSEYKITGGYKGLIEDVKPLIPKEKIKALYHQKLQTSPAFKQFIEHLSSPDFQEVVNTVYANPHFKYILNKAKQAGLDLQRVKEFLQTVLGITVPNDYYSDEFKLLVKEVDVIPNYINLLNYIYASDIDIYYLLNHYHDYMEIFRLIQPKGFFEYGIVGGYKPFKELMDHLTSLEFKKLYNTVYNDHRVQYIVNRVKQSEPSNTKSHNHTLAIMKLAVVLVAILAVANAWAVPNYDNTELKKDLQEFVNLVPVDKIKKLVLQYAAEDAEVQKGLTYAKSEEFKSMVKKVNAMPEYINLLNYIYRAGVDIYYYVNRILDYIGVPELPPPNNFSEYGITGGYKGLVEDVKKLIPKDQIKALYYQKLETSPAFKELMDHFKSSEFKKLYDTVYNDPSFQHMVVVAKQSGLDLEKLKEVFHVICPICIEL